MATTEQLHTFWAAFLAARRETGLPASQSFFDAWPFGNTPELADRLCQLVIKGEKTATAGSLWEYEYYGWPVHKAGARIVILDGRERPACVIEATDVELKPLNAVDRAFARDEGEGFHSVDDWISGHLAYFADAFAHLDLTPTPGMPMIFTRFRLVYRPQAPA